MTMGAGAHVLKKLPLAARSLILQYYGKPIIIIIIIVRAWANLGNKNGLNMARIVALIRLRSALVSFPYKWRSLYAVMLWFKHLYTFAMEAKCTTNVS